MRKQILIGFFLAVASWGYGQEVSFEVSLSADTIGIEDVLEVSFSLKNARGSAFEAPEFEGFRIVGGPNTSSQMTIINGEITQTSSYSFILEPLDIGEYYIQPAGIIADGEPLETELKTVWVFSEGGVKKKKSKEANKKAPSKKRTIIKM